MAAQGNVDAALDAAERFTVYRIRFQLLNDSDEDTSFDPVLQVAGGTSGWADVPMIDPDRGEAFYGASDDGDVFEARREALSVADLRLDSSRDPVAIVVPGHASAGLPLATIALPAHSFTEVEVAVRATTAADWGASYRFRLAGIPGDLAAASAELVMGAKPLVGAVAWPARGRASRGSRPAVPAGPLDRDDRPGDVGSDGERSYGELLAPAVRGGPELRELAARHLRVGLGRMRVVPCDP